MKRQGVDVVSIAKNDIFEVTILDMNNLGAGVAKIDGMTVFVRGAVTGDICRIRIIKVLTSYAVAIIEELLQSSVHRISSGCAVRGCGGCVYQNISMDYENELKRAYVENAFRKAGLKDVTVQNVKYAGNSIGYRNKAQYPFAKDKKTGEVYFGFYREKTHDVVRCPNCAVMPEIFSEIAAASAAFFTAHDISVYDEKSGQGLLRHLYLRLAETTGDVMVCFVINGKDLPQREMLTAQLTAKFPTIRSIWLNRNEKNTNVILGKDYRLLFGDPYLTDSILSRKFRISPQSFYQVNRRACEILYAEAGAQLDAKENETVLDLYCGIGTVGICVASNAKRLIGAEIVPEAVENARENARLNGLSNTEFLSCDADNLDIFAFGQPDAIIVDPPRKGLSPGVRQAIAMSGANRLLYISCNPDTLARDAAYFAENGYRLGPVTPVNLFPRTGHVETVVLLRREI